ncbi:acetoacetate--CoA ligase [Blastococcus tunisiensis]|uniref:Acetoacetyl-CoA synthetase n=1 Tax=Blastococcus tunisiensis TaxID=1798228 RepID=A0A1I1YEL2_9ACTN|nr:acetoacetate--CoA ligase [Blastococcus sp. DSM 46838]SFE18006.1 acetoacetyl-CoA synthetase [Blastococcus sp. DSM 46838]
MVTPTPEAAAARRFPAAQLADFRNRCEELSRRDLRDPSALHAFSVDSPELFWRTLLEWTGLPWSGSADVVRTSSDVETARFFPDVRLNYAEALLRPIDGADDDAPALTGVHADRPPETWTRRELRTAVQRGAAALSRLGLTAGERVVAIAPNTTGVAIAALSVAALGGTLSTATPDMGTTALLGRFEQVEPVLLLLDRTGMEDAEDATLALLDGLPTVRRLVVLDGGPLPDLGDLPVLRWADLAAEEGDPVDWPRLAFDHPLFVMFSSGTTGPPKAMVHGAGGTLLEHVKEHRLHGDLRAGETLYFHTTTAWMMWNWQLSALAVGAHVVVYDGPIAGPQTLWELAADHKVHVLGTSPPYLQMCQDEGYQPADEVDLGALRSVLSTGAVLHDWQFDWVAEAVGAQPLQSISGGTDIIGCFVLGHPELPVRRGRSQARSLGLDTVAVDEDGAEVVDAVGELVCRAPFPSRPVHFLRDPDGSRFHSAYFADHPGVWTHGDLIDFAPDGSARVHGRSDGVLNVNGIRIGPAEVYTALRGIDAVTEAMAVEQRDGARPGTTRMVLLLVLSAGARLDGTLEREIRRTLRRKASAAHVPSLVVAVPELPLTHNGKRSERAARDAVNGDPVVNVAALRNPDSLTAIRAAVLAFDGRLPAPPAPAVVPSRRPSADGDLQGAVARIWRETLGLAAAEPDDHFFDLGGTSRQVMGLLHRLRTEVGRDVPITDFITAPTLGELTRLAGAGAPGAAVDMPAAPTHPGSFRELLRWMAEDAEVNRRRGGGTLSVLAAGIFRINQYGTRRRGPVASVVRVLSLPLVAFARLGLNCELPGELACGRRLVLAHGGRGIIIVRDAVLGDDVVMAPYASVGAAYPTPGAPVIGDGVYLGAHATVLGPITVGDGAFLGARSFVLRDVAPGGVALGVPSEIVDPH